MKFVVAMDSFKGSMTSLQAGQAVKNGILRAYAKCENVQNNETDSIQNELTKPNVTVVPIADGGEGTVEALTFGRNVRKLQVSVTGPLGTPVLADYIIVDGDTAIIEMASAAGLPLVPEELRNPMHTTTYGVGELINHAICEGCMRFIIGIGGSATNDCGIGMLQALGFDILDNDLKNVKNGTIGLREARIIQDKHINPILKSCEFIIACDVDNPLVGEKGCSVVFAPQKGATPKMVKDMDAWMNSFADIVESYVNYNFQAPSRFTPGAGAAGGMGYAFLMFLGGKLMSGAEIVMKWTGLEEKIIDSNFVIIGEGKLDKQSSMGKIPIQIASLASKHGKKIIAFAGIVEDVPEGVEAHQIERGNMSLSEAMITENAVSNLENTVYNVFLSS